MINDERRIKLVLGERIRKRRKELGLTQENLSEALNVSIRYISQIERGETNPAINRFVHLANALEIDIFDLLTDKSLDSVIQKYNLLSERDKKLIRDLMNKMLETS